VNEAVRKHLRADNLIVAVVTEDAQGFLKALQGGKPTPIRYDTSGTPAEILAEDKIIEKFPVKLNAERSRIVASAELFER
jgi:zinc protease